MDAGEKQEAACGLETQRKDASMKTPERTSYLMRSIRREYYTNLIVGIILSGVVGAIVHTFS